jgi:hypothetical protein
LHTNYFSNLKFLTIEPIMRNSVITRPVFISIFSTLLIFLYIYTATSKLFDMHKFRTVLAKSPMIDQYALLLSWIIPFLEFIVSTILFIPHLRRIGFLFSSILMTGFTLYITYMLVFMRDLPCSCGGVISKLTWPQHLLFNVIFLAISIAGLMMSKKKSRVLLQ